MFTPIKAVATNPQTQADFKGFLQEYHKQITQEHGLRPLKLGKALHWLRELALAVRPDLF